jgi:hypothetical protein
MTSKNDITGDSIVNSKGSQEKYRSGWDLIWNKDKPKQDGHNDNQAQKQNNTGK